MIVSPIPVPETLNPSQFSFEYDKKPIGCLCNANHTVWCVPKIPVTYNFASVVLRRQRNVRVSADPETSFWSWLWGHDQTSSWLYGGFTILAFFTNGRRCISVKNASETFKKFPREGGWNVCHLKEVNRSFKKFLNPSKKHQWGGERGGAQCDERGKC